MKNIHALNSIRKKSIILLMLFISAGLPGIYVSAGENIEQRAFITTWRFEPTNARKSLGIGMNVNYEYDFVVDWGDGSAPEAITIDANPSNPSRASGRMLRTESFTYFNHLYSEPGEYQVSITGSFPSLTFSHFDDQYGIYCYIKSVNQWGSQKWKSMFSMFNECPKFELDLIDPTEVPDLSEIDPDGRGLSSMFAFSSFDGDISQWDVSNVTDMSRMFLSSAFNGDLSQWDVSNVTDMSKMFSFSDFNGDISRWDTSNVTNMYEMFSYSSAFSGDISRWDVSNVNDMSWMFLYNSVFNGDISHWDVSNVAGMTGMFYRNSAFRGEIGQWDVSNVNDMSDMFGSSNFSGDISRWDVSNVTRIYSMFYNARRFKGNLSRWDIRNAGTYGRFIENTAISKSTYTSLLRSWANLNWESRGRSIGQIDVGTVQFRTIYDDEENDETLEAKIILERAGWRFVDGGGYDKNAERDNE